MTPSWLAIWHLHDVHVHAFDNESMRTTIEMMPEHREVMPELAAQRGENGFSSVVAEALEVYIQAQRGRKKAIQNALGLKGSISDSEAEGLLTRNQNIRTTGDDHSRYGCTHRLLSG